jgi:hypothetical protein
LTLAGLSAPLLLAFRGLLLSAALRLPSPLLRALRLLLALTPVRLLSALLWLFTSRLLRFVLRLLSALLWLFTSRLLRFVLRLVPPLLWLSTTGLLLSALRLLCSAPARLLTPGRFLHARFRQIRAALTAIPDTIADLCATLWTLNHTYHVRDLAYKTSV